MQGMQIVPADIECILLAHPAVVEAAVIGVPDELAGERPRAFVVRSGSVMADLDEEELRDSIDDQVESKLHETHWLNGRIDFLPDIPKSQNGKVLRRELRDMIATK
jgi:acyl-coenzyme A synthetase/AMP-(fatty) acid ligase